MATDTTNLPSVFEALTMCSFRGVGFPLLSLRSGFRQDQAVHKWPDRDGAHVEATGRDPFTFHARAAFRNGVTPGRNESGEWGPLHALYPDHFRGLFLPAVLDRTTGAFNHPELGAIQCKCVSVEFDHDPHKRDGVDVDMEFIESLDNPDQLQAIIAAPSPIGATSQFAADLDAQLSGTTFSSPPAPTGFVEPSFSDAMRSIQSATDQTSLLSRKLGGQVDHVFYRVQAIEDSVATSKDVTLWPLTNSAERMKAGLLALKASLAISQKTILTFVAQSTMTLSQVSVQTGNKVQDLIKLNPTLCAAPTIPRYTPVRCYSLTS